MRNSAQIPEASLLLLGSSCGVSLLLLLELAFLRTEQERGKLSNVPCRQFLCLTALHGFRFDTMRVQCSFIGVQQFVPDISENVFALPSMLQYAPFRIAFFHIRVVLSPC